LVSEELPDFNTVWKLAEDMGARCFSDVDDSVTHVVATASTTMMAEWARDNNKILVTPRWIETAHYFWKWPKEEDFTVL
jgi:RNA polymerase II C-terminal domain phosphatase-like 3/4